MDALRSGRYKQVFGWLRATDADCDKQFYCCFGVACEISNLADWQDATEKDESGDWERGDYYLGCDTELPDEVVRHYGLASGSGVFEWKALPLKVRQGLNPHNESFPASLEASLVSLNDSGHTFSTTADVIEAEPHGLFV